MGNMLDKKLPDEADDNHLQDDDFVPSITYELPRLSLYETLDLNIAGKTQSHGLAIVRDSMYADVYYIYHSAGVHAVTISGWLDVLKDMKIKMELDASEEESTFRNWQSKAIPSEVCLVVDSAPLQNRYALLTLQCIFFCLTKCVLYILHAIY